MCIRHLKGEDANTQLMYLGGVSLVGSLFAAMLLQQWTLPSNFLEWMLLLLTGAMLPLSRNKTSVCLCATSYVYIATADIKASVHLSKLQGS